MNPSAPAGSSQLDFILSVLNLRLEEDVRISQHTSDGSMTDPVMGLEGSVVIYMTSLLNISGYALFIFSTGSSTFKARDILERTSL